jgi:uncharacterized cupredoxin-like copper-binding protein
MTAYYVLGAVFVVLALVLSAIGLTRDGFPGSPAAGRAIVLGVGLFAVVTFGVLLATTEKEHPREHAAAEAAEKKEAAEGGGGAESGGEAEGGGPIEVVENEYSIELPAGEKLRAGKQEFEVANEGKVPHDLAVVNGKETKTPLIDGGEKASLEVDLQPGKHKLYCTVPGHEELGMKTEVTVD